LRKLNAAVIIYSLYRASDFNAILLIQCIKQYSNEIRQEHYFEVESYEAAVTDRELKRYFERI